MKIKIDYFKLVSGLVIFILGVLAVLYGANQMQSSDITKISFYGILVLLIAKELAWSFESIVRSIETKQSHPNQQNQRGKT